MADLNEDDAREMGIKAGDTVEIETMTSKIRMKANPSVKIRKGDVQIYHGYTEANANDLIEVPIQIRTAVIRVLNPAGAE